MAKIDPVEAAATTLLNWMASIDPMWASYVEIARTELLRTDRQLVGAWLAYTLDSGAHMVVPNRPEFEPGYAITGSERRCEWCDTVYRPTFGGQRFCGTLCAERWMVNNGVPLVNYQEPVRDLPEMTDELHPEG